MIKHVKRQKFFKIGAKQILKILLFLSRWTSLTPRRTHWTQTTAYERCSNDKTPEIKTVRQHQSRLCLSTTEYRQKRTVVKNEFISVCLVGYDWSVEGMHNDGALRTNFTGLGHCVPRLAQLSIKTLNLLTEMSPNHLFKNVKKVQMKSKGQGIKMCIYMQPTCYSRQLLIIV